MSFKFNYTEDFINEVKAVYPSEALLHSMVNNGTISIKQILISLAGVAAISTKEILEETSLHMLQTKAAVIERRHRLYASYLTETAKLVWNYSERGRYEMQMLNKQGSAYPFPIPESWKDYYISEEKPLEEPNI